MAVLSSNPVPGQENGLHKDRTAHQIAHLQPHHRQRGGRGIFHDVDKDARLVEPASAQANDKLLAEDIDTCERTVRAIIPVGITDKVRNNSSMNCRCASPIASPPRLSAAAGGRQQRRLNAAEDHQRGIPSQ